ncbi:MAG: ABC transporter ATP-binding protein [bacterium]
MGKDEKVISLENLVKTYTMGEENIVHALDGISFEISRGEMVAITGPSGSGKSTLMNIIGCLDRPDSGRYILAGDDVFSFPDNKLARLRNRRIGFIFQTFNLLPRISALENVELPLIYGEVSNAREQAAKALESVGLGDRMNHAPNQLSGGQRQRVAAARAIVTDPDILLADEPTGNLDSETGVEILELFGELNDMGRTLVIVSHDPRVASTCPREVSLLDGQLKNKAAEVEPGAAVEHT